MTSPALELRSVVAGYSPDLPIVRGASLRVMPGEIVALLGPNGAGKSTLIKAVAGLVRVSSGEVLLLGEDITNTPVHAAARRGVGYVPQTDNVFTSLTVHENLRVAAHQAHGGREARIARMYGLFPDLARLRRSRGGQLSGGQRQMLAIARALLMGPALLMPDEPSAGLSPQMVHSVFDKLRELADGGVSVLMVEQNVKAALRIADRAYVLTEGRERLEGPARALIGDSRLADLYLGRTEKIQ